MPLLSFISDEDLYTHCRNVVDTVKNAEIKKTNTIHKNTIDPFAAVFDSVRLGLPISEWLHSVEIPRQIQKTMQNAIGDFHENIIGSIEGWEVLYHQGIDVVSHDKRIVAEIKNKHNTMKGDTQFRIYDVLKNAISSNQYKKYIGYAVQIIPNSSSGFNKEFTPSVSGKRKPLNKKIRKIDGKSFYAIATGQEDALSSLYKVLPQVLGDIFEVNSDYIYQEQIFSELFNKAYFDSFRK